jgi:TRAP-type C4-dicarboxylate transport system permease small subunit
MDSWFFYLFFSIYFCLALLCFIAPIVKYKRKKKREQEYEMRRSKIKLVKEKNDNDI